MAQAPLSDPDRRIEIVLVGHVGCGKSASGNTILGREEFKSSCSFSTVTKTCERKREAVCGRKIALVDTPGLDCAEVSSYELFLSLKKKTYKIINIFLLVIQLGRFTEEQNAAVQKMEDMFGVTTRELTMILFTHGDKLKHAPIEDYVRKAGEPLGQVVQRYGQRYHVFNNESGPPSQVTELFDKINRMQTVMHNRFYNFSSSGAMNTELVLYTSMKTGLSLREVKEVQEKADVLLKSMEPKENTPYEIDDSWTGILESDISTGEESNTDTQLMDKALDKALELSDLKRQVLLFRIAQSKALNELGLTSKLDLGIHILTDNINNLSEMEDIMEDDVKGLEEIKRLEEMRKRLEEEGKRLEEEGKRREEEGKRLEEGKRREEEGKRLEEMRKIREEERKIREEEIKICEEERQIREEKRIMHDGPFFMWHFRNEKGRRLEEEGIRLEEEGKRLEEKGIRLEEEGKRLEEKGIRLEEKGKIFEELWSCGYEERKILERKRREEERKRCKEERKRRGEMDRPFMHFLFRNKEKIVEEERKICEEERDICEERKRCEEMDKIFEELWSCAYAERKILEEKRKRCEEERKRHEKERKRREEERKRREEERKRREVVTKIFGERGIHFLLECEYFGGEILEERKRCEEERKRCEEERKRCEEERKKREEERKRLEEMRKICEERKRHEEERKRCEKMDKIFEELWSCGYTERKILEEKRKRCVEEKKRHEKERERHEEERERGEEERKRREEERERHEEERERHEEERERHEEERKRHEEEIKRREEERKRREEERKIRNEERKICEEERKT